MESRIFPAVILLPLEYSRATWRGIVKYEERKVQMGYNEFSAKKEKKEGKEKGKIQQSTLLAQECELSKLSLFKVLC